MATARGFARTGLTWDARARRYRSASGRFLSAARVQGILEEQISATGARMREVSEALQSGRINLAQWQLEIEGQIKRLHLMAFAVNEGGFNQLTRSDLGWVGGQVRRQYEYLRNFARQIERGEQPLDGRFLARVQLYAEAARGTEREAARRTARADGATAERRVLGIADHCPTCVSEARKGWRPVGTLRRIGDSECRSRCRCAFQFQYQEAA
jgi:hypothetical protein